MDGDDIREVELTAITAIYPPEELHVDENDPYSFTIELSVSLTKPLVVKFPAATEAARPVPVPGAAPTDGQTGQINSQELSNLPSLQIHFTLPDGYPQDKPPKVSISTSPPWLPESVVSELEAKAEKCWEDVGRDQVIFDYVDDVRQSVDDVFGLIADDNSLEVGPEHKIAILDYDIEAKRRDFQKRTFDCGICLDPKKGSVCHRMLDCGHVFCVQCLQDFYNNAITEGDVAAVQCLEPNCAATREKAAREQAGPGRKRKPKTFISPSELLQIPLDQEMVKRYVTMKHKTELESDKNTVYCPRAWCQGAARSKKHKKPEGLEFVDASEDESDEEQPPQPGLKMTKESVNRELLAICEDCGFAFCSRCGQSWHGEFKYCMPKERKEEITEEEKASLEYLKLHTTPCPTCSAPCQKTQGCNHMRCFKCQTHFCYLCSAWLNPENPYQHFNILPSGGMNGCYMRLWELGGGDGNDVGIEYRGRDAEPDFDFEEEEEDDDSDDGDDGEVEVVPDYQWAIEDAQAEAAAAHARDEPARDEPARRVEPQQDAPQADEQQQQPQPELQPQPQPAIQRRVGVAREGPLVLRIDGDAPAPAPAAPAQPPAAAPMNARGGGGRMQRGRGGAGGNRGGRPPRGHGHAGRPNNARNQGQQNQNQRPNRGGGRNNDNNNNNNNNNNRNNAADRRVGHGPVRRLANEDWDEDEAHMNVADALWIRNFVHLALNDQEHLIDGGDSSGDEAN